MPCSASWMNSRNACGLQVAAGGAGDGEAIELREVAGIDGRGRLAGVGSAARAIGGPVRRPGGEPVRTRRGASRAGLAGRGHDAERPSRRRGDGAEADLVVARLVTKLRGIASSPGGTAVDRELGADHELALEHGERLRLSFLREVGWMREDELCDLHARGRIDGQHRRDERRIPWLVGLDVQPLGQRRP